MSDDLPTYAQKLCNVHAGLRLAKTFVCCCPDQLNKRLTDSKIESVRRKLCSVRMKSTFVVASSQSQLVAFMTRSATVTFANNNYGGLVDRRTRDGADRYVAGSARIIRNTMSAAKPNNARFFLSSIFLRHRY